MCRLKHVFDPKHYKLLDTPSDSDVYIYQKNPNNYIISRHIGLDLYNIYYVLSGYANINSTA